MYTLPHETLWVAYSNVCSVKTKMHDIQTAKNLKYSDILWLRETWLQNTDDTNKCTLQDYTTHCTDMFQENVPSITHHGLLMYVHKNIRIIEIHMLYKVIDIYKAPRMTLQKLKKIQYKCNSKSYIILCDKLWRGCVVIEDFNINVRKSNTLCDYMKNTYDMHQWVK